MSKALSKFYDYLLPELPGCTTAFVDLHLRQVARELCESTSAWVESFPPITFTAATLAYYFSTPDSAGELVRFTELSVNGTLVWRATEPREPMAGDDPRRPRFPAHRPPFTIDTPREQITLVEQPDGDIALVGALRPTMAATVLPDLLFNHHMDAIRFGVLSRLKLMSGKKWTDREGGLQYQYLLNARRNLHAAQAANGNTGAPMRTRTTRI